MQTKTQVISFGLRSLLTGAFLAALSSCGGGGGIPDPDPTPGASTGEVTITPDWGSIPASSTLRFHFYPVSGPVVTKDGDATGFKIALENGTYRVLAYNTDATGVTFENTDSYDKSAVRVSPVATRALSAINQPGNVYALSMDVLNVEKGGVVTQKATVRALVKRLKLNLSISDTSMLKDLKGSLNGFLPSVLLSTGKPSSDASDAAPSTFRLFDVSLSGKSATVELSSLGMLDPKDGSAYACELTFYITDRDGLPLTATVDVNKVLTAILAANGGVLPDGTPAELNLELKVTEGLALTVVIKDWLPGSNMPIDLFN